MAQTKLTHFTRLLVSVLLLASACSLVCAEPLRVTASILPLADWVRNVGGQRVVVSCVLSGGLSPHTFTPSPTDVQKIARADLFVMVGVGLEEWAEDFITSAGRSGLAVVKLGERIGFGQGQNPHVWLHPELASKMVLEIAKALASIDPDAAISYRLNAETYVAKIKALDRRYAPRFAAIGKRSVVQFHPAFTYLLDHYGIASLGVIEASPGKEPSSKHLERIIIDLRRQAKRVVLIEPQLFSKAAETVAREARASMVTLDPLGDQADPSRSTYLSLMEFNLESLLSSLR